MSGKLSSKVSHLKIMNLNKTPREKKKEEKENLVIVHSYYSHYTIKFSLIYLFILLEIQLSI